MKRAGKNENKGKSGLPKGKMPLDNVKMGEFSDLDPTEGEITPESDGLEQNPGERLEFGFSFTPEEGRLGEENEYYGDMPPEAKAVGNRYDPTLSTGRAHLDINEEEVEGIHYADESNIGMAYGKDKYVDDDGDEKKSMKRGGGKDEGRKQL